MPETAFGELRVLQKLNEYEFGFEADILRDGPVQGGRWVFENLGEYYKTFAGRPVLVAYVGSRVGDGHNAREVRDPKTGEIYRSFLDPTAERIVGTISEEVSDLSLVEENGYTWLRVKGRLFTEYCRELVDTIVRTGRMAVSIEANVYDVREEEGVEHYDRWIALGLTILNPDVAPAVPGANIRALSDMEEEFAAMKLRVASLVEESQTHNTEPQTQKLNAKGVETSMIFSKQQLKELQEKFGADYKVLSGYEKDGVSHLMLMRKSDHTFCSYELSEKDAAVYTERIVKRAASINLNAAEGEEEMCAEAGEVICDELAEAAAENETLCSENKRLSAELESTKNQLTAMQEFETKRRTNAAADHAKNVLAQYNANRKDKVSETVIASVIKDAEDGAYNARTDADGNWIGLSAVEKDVKALCADEQMKLDEKAAKAEKGEFVWAKLGNRNASLDDGSIAALINSL